MEENKNQKVIITTLAAMLIASLLFMFGISIKESILPLITNFIISLLLYVCSFIVVYKHYKKNKENIFLYLIILNGFLIVFILYVFISSM